MSFKNVLYWSVAIIHILRKTVDRHNTNVCQLHKKERNHVAIIIMTMMHEYILSRK